MALLPILEYPDARLKRIASTGHRVHPGNQSWWRTWRRPCIEAPGIGLAATQVDVHKRVIVIDVSQDKSDLKVFINPEIIEADGEIVGEEGCFRCLSTTTMCAAAHVKVRAQDADGKPFELEATELLAVCIQHEMDHLKGIVFVDHLSQLSKCASRAR